MFPLTVVLLHQRESFVAAMYVRFDCADQTALALVNSKLPLSCAHAATVLTICQGPRRTRRQGFPARFRRACGADGGQWRSVEGWRCEQVAARVGAECVVACWSAAVDCSMRCILYNVQRHYPSRVLDSRPTRSSSSEQCHRARREPVQRETTRQNDLLHLQRL